MTLVSKLLQRGNISRDILLTFGARVGVTLAGALAGIALARLLGAPEYGRFSFAYSIILMILIFSKLGLDNASVKFIAEYIAKKEYGKLFGFLNAGRRWLYGTSLFALMGTGVVLLLFDVEPQQQLIILSALPTFVLLSQLHFDQQVLNGLQKTAFSPVPEGILRAVILCALLASWWWLSLSKLSAEVAFLLNGVALAIALLVTRLYVRKVCKRYSEGKRNIEHENRRWFFTGTAHLLIACSHIILSQTDIFMLGIFSESATVGYYAVAVQVSTLLLFFGNVINPVITPRMASAYSTGDYQTLVKHASFGTNVSFFLSLPVLAALYVFRHEILTFLFGSEYLPAAGILVVLLFAQLAKLLSAPIGFVMTMTEREKLATYVIGGSALLNIFLNLFLIPKYGAIGAAAATTCSALLWNAILIALVWRRFGVLLLPILSLRKHHTENS